MPQPGKAWRHVIINTRCSWLHGDRRGFRSRRHRIHSSGDYKHPPPLGEHAGLRRYHERRSGKAITFADEVRYLILRAFVLKMQSQGHQILCGSCGEKHLHALCELPTAPAQVKKIVGKCKQYASHQVRELLLGSIWARGGTLKMVKDRAHHRRVFDYIRFGQESDAITWSFLKDENWIE